MKTAAYYPSFFQRKLGHLSKCKATTCTWSWREFQSRQGTLVVVFNLQSHQLWLYSVHRGFSGKHRCISCV